LRYKTIECLKAQSWCSHRN